MTFVGAGRYRSHKQSKATQPRSSCIPSVCPHLTQIIAVFLRWTPTGEASPSSLNSQATNGKKQSQVVSVRYWTPCTDHLRNPVCDTLGKRKAHAERRMEHQFNCPYCGEEISMLLDLSVSRQTYIEDCEVCCKPIEISFTVEDEELATFYAKTLG